MSCGPSQLGCLGGEVMETDKDIVVRVEVPGWRRKIAKSPSRATPSTCEGKKRFERMAEEGSFHVMERALWQFSSVPFRYPRMWNSAAAEASYKNGVLSCACPRWEAARPSGSRSIKMTCGSVTLSWSQYSSSAKVP